MSQVQHTFSHYPAIPPRMRVPLTVIPEHTCSYFPDRRATSRAFMAAEIDPRIYHQLMDAGFRRSGRIVYQPICAGCRECISIRVPVGLFMPSRSQRRAWRRNQDLRVTVGEPVADDEAFALYARYVRDWHASVASDGDDRGSFESFLYDSPVRTIEMRYRDPSGRLLAVGLCDVCEGALSSMYFYFDPRERVRSLGTFGVLFELDYARQHRIEHYYLGYWIAGCGKMSYKSAYRPCELLCGDGVWRELGDGS